MDVAGSSSSSSAGADRDKAEAPTPPLPPDPPRRCFICLTDEEPTDPKGSWVDPCPCTLEAHQDCMLSWVTDCERSNKPLKCPVCKVAIQMEGPWDPIAAVRDAVLRGFTRASPFILLAGVAVGTQFSLQMYGTIALWTFAGKDAVMGGGGGGGANKGAGMVWFAKEKIVQTLVLTNVAPTLLASQLLPGLSNKYFVQLSSMYGIFGILANDHFLEWPPSPRLVFVALPLIRRFYFCAWRDYVLPYEVKLNRQIMGLLPLDPQQQNRGLPIRHDPDRHAEGGFIGLLQTILDVLDPDDEEDVDAGGDGNNGDHDGDNDGAQLAPRVVREQVRMARGNDEQIMVELLIEHVEEAQNEEPRLDDDSDEDEAGEPENRPQQRLDEPAPAVNRREAPQAPPARRMGLGGLLSTVSNSIVSALLLPAISFAMGEALRLVLPRSWTAAAARNPGTRMGRGGRPGLLQQQWGRSLIGGCLYVVLNDAIRVYSKRRKVAAMENRKVKNVERARRKK